MRTLSIAIAATLVFLVSPAQADPPRHPLSGPPRIARGVVERFLLLQKQLMLHQDEGALDGIIAIQGGVLMPVSEDRDGIYYQNPNGVWVRDLNSTSFFPLGGILYPGGLWFSKTDPNRVRAYKGDARKPKQYLQREWRSISPRALAALKVGHVVKPTTKRSR
jgi:hypothetical protein